MKSLTEVMKDVDQLSDEDRAGLAAHLLVFLKDSPLGPDDQDLSRREAEIDAGTAAWLTDQQLREAVGR